MPEKLKFSRNQTSIGVVEEIEAESTRRFTISGDQPGRLKIDLALEGNGVAILKIFELSSDKSYVFFTSNAATWLSDEEGQDYLIEIQSQKDPVQFELWIEMIQTESL